MIEEWEELVYTGHTWQCYHVPDDIHRYFTACGRPARDVLMPMSEAVKLGKRPCRICYRGDGGHYETRKETTQ